MLACSMEKAKRDDFRKISPHATAEPASDSSWRSHRLDRKPKPALSALPSAIQQPSNELRT